MFYLLTCVETKNEAQLLFAEKAASLVRLEATKRQSAVFIVEFTNCDNDMVG